MIEVELMTGETGHAVSLDGERLRLIGPRAYAQGTPLSMVVKYPDGDVASVSAKTIGSRRLPDDGVEPDSRFEIEARLVSCRRETRERLAAALSDG